MCQKNILGFEGQNLNDLILDHEFLIHRYCSECYQCGWRALGTIFNIYMTLPGDTHHKPDISSIV